MAEHQACTACPLCTHRTQVVLPDGPPGRLLALGEAPGAVEDTQGVGFAGAAGRNLDRAMHAQGLGRGDYARANVVTCRPPDNRRPRRAEVSACRGWLLAWIEHLSPTVILTVGESAARASVSIAPRERYLAFVQRYLSGIHFLGGKLTGLSHFYATPVIPMPHTSPLAWNRRTPTGEPIRAVGEQAIRLAAVVHEHRRREALQPEFGA
jgi:uracil-DNA glycosylase family 4